MSTQQSFYHVQYLDHETSYFGGSRYLQGFFGVIGFGSTAVVAYFIYKKYLARMETLRKQKEQKGKERMKKSAVKEKATEKVEEPVSEPLSTVSIEDEEMNNVPDVPQKPQVIMYRTSQGNFTPSTSPFAFKLETFLRIAKIPYKVY
jgi:hypothetical protein